MIINFLLSAFVLTINLLFSILPDVSTLPIMFGYDIDTALTNGVTMLYTFADVVWPVGVVLQGFLVLLGYYSLKIVVKMIMGSRTPMNIN